MSGHHEGGESRCLEVIGASLSTAAQPGHADLYARHGGQMPVALPGAAGSDGDDAADIDARCEGLDPQERPACSCAANWTTLQLANAAELVLSGSNQQGQTYIPS